MEIVSEIVLADLSSRAFVTVQIIKVTGKNSYKPQPAYRSGLQLKYRSVESFFNKFPFYS
jgi:hypothetical protein